MPYIERPAREALDSRERMPASPGELNYQVTVAFLRALAEFESGETRILPYVQLEQDTMRTCREYLTHVTATQKLRYQHINDVMGVLACARQEFLRRGTTRRVATFDNFAKVLAAVSADFYAEVAVPYETAKIAENGDLPYVG